MNVCSADCCELKRQSVRLPRHISSAHRSPGNQGQFAGRTWNGRRLPDVHPIDFHLRKIGNLRRDLPNRKPIPPSDISSSSAAAMARPSPCEKKLTTRPRNVGTPATSTRRSRRQSIAVPEAVESSLQTSTRLHRAQSYGRTSRSTGRHKATPRNPPARKLSSARLTRARILPWCSNRTTGVF